MPNHETGSPRGGILDDDPGQQAADLAPEPIAREGLVMGEEHEHRREAGRHARQTDEAGVRGEGLPPAIDPRPTGQPPAAPVWRGAGLPEHRMAAVRGFVEKRRHECGQPEEGRRRREDLWKAVCLLEPAAEPQPSRRDRQNAPQGDAHEHRPATVPGSDELSLKRGDAELIEPVTGGEGGVDDEKEDR